MHPQKMGDTDPEEQFLLENRRQYIRLGLKFKDTGDSGGFRRRWVVLR